MSRARTMIEAEVLPMKTEGNAVTEGWFKVTEMLMQVTARIAAMTASPAAPGRETTLQAASAVG